jgi:hypothetical protein
MMNKRDSKGSPYSIALPWDRIRHEDLTTKFRSMLGDVSGKRIIEFGSGLVGTAPEFILKAQKRI